MKKILIIGAIALVIIGCVLAAGCTSTNDDKVNQLSGFLSLDGENQPDGAPELVGGIMVGALKAGLFLDEDPQIPSPEQDGMIADIVM